MQKKFLFLVGLYSVVCFLAGYHTPLAFSIPFALAWGFLLTWFAIKRHWI